MLSAMRARILLLASTSMVVASLLAPRAATAQTSPVPRFEAASCPFKVDPSLTEGKDVRCGYLIVPENRSVANGKTIKLAVEIVKSASDHPAADPVFFLDGGPGGSALMDLGQYVNSSNRDFLAGDRDLVLIDQRGTGYSQPNLRCQEAERMGQQIETKRVSLQQEATLEGQAAVQCRARLVKEGVDLSAYNSVDNAHDIADLRVALGYQQVNLYGVSYGTRLALTVMRYFPQGIRSVVLDSVYGPTVNIFTDPERSAARVFNLVFDACAKNAHCRRTYPHVRNDFYQLVQRLDRNPIHVVVNTPQGRLIKIVVTGETVVDVVFAALYNAAKTPDVRFAMVQAQRGQYSWFGDLASSVMSPVPASWGMFLSVECSEDAPGTTQADIVSASQALPALLRRDFTATWDRLFHDCQIWNVPGVAPAQKQPVVSAIPTMVMEGQNDPITPPQYGADVARTLSHSFSFVYPNAGHATRFQSACASKMMWAFFDDPSQKPDDACIPTSPRSSVFGRLVTRVAGQ